MKAIALAPALLLLTSAAVFGYVVGPPLSLDEMEAKADVIFQGTVLSNTTVPGSDFEKCSGFLEQETTFRPAWPTKGNLHANEIKFRHYAPDPQGGGFMFAPQNYTFEVGKSYIVFAKQPSGDADHLEQMWTYPTWMADAGVLRTARPEPFGHRTMKELYWRDLTELLKSQAPQDLVYAIKHLNTFSGGDGFRNVDATSVFQRLDVLATVHALVGHHNLEVAQAAIEVLGSNNPYMTPDNQRNWLGTVAGTEMPGFMRGDRNYVNTGGMIYWRELAAVVDSKAGDETRALAVRALGLVREPSLEGSAQRWLGDPSAKVRAAAVLLLADFPALCSHDRLTALAADPDVETRISTAYVIGFTQNVEELSILVRLLSDSDDHVRQAASQCLQSFSPNDPRVQKIFRDNLANPELRPLVIVALGQQDPAANLDLLIDETAKKTDPDNWPGGQIPAYTTSHLLFDYLKKQPAADLQSGKYDKALDALEIWKPNYAVDPQFIYALELKDGLKDRAKKFRAAAVKAAPYESTYLDNADKDPDQYLY